MTLLISYFGKKPRSCAKDCSRVAGQICCIIIYCFFLAACQASALPELVLFDFESDAELDLFQWKCHTLFSLSEEHATHGKKSLRLELHPSDYPGLAPIIAVNDWSRYKALCFDVYMEEKESILFVRIDDAEYFPDSADRFHKGFKLRKGDNRVVIFFDSLITSGTHRKLNLGKISRLMIFMTNPEKPVVLHVDNIRLIRARTLNESSIYPEGVEAAGRLLQ